jgi:hypothetical protein
MDEKTLKTMVDAAAIKRARIVAQGANFHVEIDAPGRSFTIATAKGGLRTWRSIDANARWLRSMGIAQSTLDVSRWHPGQRSLQLADPLPRVE